MKKSLILFVAMPSAAFAHTGHEAAGFAAGFGHPFGGTDHMLAMFALGLLAAQVGGRAIWALPLTFVVAMLAGGVAGAAGLPFPGVEPAILASCIVLGAVVAMALRLPLAVMVAAAAVFGAAHGWAHGAEGPATGLVAYAAGFALATAALHGLGIAFGRAIPPVAIRFAGAMAATAGGALAVMP